MCSEQDISAGGPLDGVDGQSGGTPVLDVLTSSFLHYIKRGIRGLKRRNFHSVAVLGVSFTGLAYTVSGTHQHHICKPWSHGI